jgi:hypothetical protein
LPRKSAQHVGIFAIAARRAEIVALSFCEMASRVEDPAGGSAWRVLAVEPTV